MSIMLKYAEGVDTTEFLLASCFFLVNAAAIATEKATVQVNDMKVQERHRAHESQT